MSHAITNTNDEKPWAARFVCIFSGVFCSAISEYHQCCHRPVQSSKPSFIQGYFSPRFKNWQGQNEVRWGPGPHLGRGSNESIQATSLWVFRTTIKIAKFVEHFPIPRCHNICSPRCGFFHSAGGMQNKECYGKRVFTGFRWKQLSSLNYIVTN